MAEPSNASVSEPPLPEAARLIVAAMNLPGGYVRPRALAGWIFSIAPSGAPIGIRIAPKE